MKMKCSTYILHHPLYSHKKLMILHCNCTLARTLASKITQFWQRHTDSDTLLRSIRWLIVGMEGHVIHNLQQNYKPEDCNNGNNDWYEIPSSSCWLVKVPDDNHSHILTVNDWIIDNVSDARMSLNQVEVIEHTNKCCNSIKAQFLYLCGAESCTLSKYPHKHNDPVNSTHHKESILCTRCKHSKSQHSRSYYKYAP